MTLKYMTALILFACSLFASGCATVLTVANPPITETRHGDTLQGDPIGFNYAMTEEKNDLVLQKQPVCQQKIQLVNVKRKRLHGIIPAVIEMPFFGLGLLDIVVAGTITRGTIDEEPGDIINGSWITSCGKFQPAVNQEVLIQYPVSVTVKDVKTDEAGRISMKDLRPSNPRDHQFTIFVREKTGLSYVKTYDKTTW